MIWPRLSGHTSLLFVAAFADDPARALRAAQRWFEATETSQITYDDHRLIAAIGHRFAGNPALDPHRDLILSVSKQLWLRGARVMARLAVLSLTFETMRVPWMLMGNAVWLVRGQPLFRDVERAVILVAEDAFTYAMSRLWDAGWLPYDGTTIYTAPDPVSLIDATKSALLLCSDKRVRATLPKVTPAALWGRSPITQAFNGTFRLPPPGLLVPLAQVFAPRDRRDVQWAVDLAEIRARDPDVAIKLAGDYRRMRRQVWLAEKFR